MTGTGGVQGRAHDPDATQVLPVIRGATAGPVGAAAAGPVGPGTELPANAHDVTAILPAITLSTGRSVGFPFDVASAVTAEHPLVPDRRRPDGAAGGPPVASSDGASVARHGAVMAAGSMISRITGFVRTAAIGAAIGAYAFGNDYTVANTLPGMVYELLLGGVLASVVIPLLVRARTRDADRGEAYTQRLMTLAVVFLIGATTLAVLFAPVFTALLTDRSTHPTDKAQITTLSYLLLPMIFFYGMSALFAAVLNTRGHFAMPTFTPILNNIVVIAMAVVFIMVTPIADGATALSPTQIAVLGLGTTLGIVVQAIGLFPALRKVGFAWRWRWDFRELHLRELGRVSAWMLVYVIGSQVGLLVVVRLAETAGSRVAKSAGPLIYNNAFLIFMMAHGIVAVSIITALMPRMAAAAAERRNDDLIAQLSLGTRLTAVVLVPATAAYVVLSRPLAVTLFQWHNYGHPAAIATGWVIALAGLGLVPFAISQLQLFAFYAMPDTKTPALINLPVVALRILVDLLLFVVLPASSVAAGLMGGNAVSFVLAVALGYWLLRRRVGRLGLTEILRTLVRLALAALIACVPTLLVVIGLTAMWNDGKVASLVQLVVGGVVLIGVYIAVAFALKVREIRDLADMVRARIGR